MPEASNIVTSENRAEYMSARMAKPPILVTPTLAPSPAAENPAPAPESKESDEHKKNGLQQRFSELTGARKEAERREREAMDRVSAMEAEIASLKAGSKPAEASDGRPDPNKFKDPIDYTEALADWKVEQKLRKRDEDDRKVKVEAAQAAIAKSWNAKTKAASADFEDYGDVMADASFPITSAVRDFFLDSDIGAHVQYYLASHRDELEQINELTPVKAIKALEKIESKLEADRGKQKDGKLAVEKQETKPDKANEAPVRPVKRTQEPPEPITPISGNGSGGHVGIEDAKGNITGDFKSYKAARKAGKIR